MATNKKVLVKKTVKKIAKKRSGVSKEAKIQRNLDIARDLMEHKVEGFLLIAKITQDGRGFIQEGAAIVNDATNKQMAQIVMNNLELEPYDFIFAQMSLKSVVDMTNKKK